MWSDWLVFCDYGFSVSAVWCPLTTLAVLFGFLLPWTWGISSRLLQKVQPLLLTLDTGCLLTAALPVLEGGIAPLGPPLPEQPPLLGHGIAPLGCRPWPQTLGSSFQPLLCRCSLALSVTAPDLGWGVSPLGHASACPSELVHFCESITIIKIVEEL